MKGSLLIIDDEEMIRELLASALDVEGYECFIAGNTEEALKIVSERDIDVALLDIMMPGQTGIELLPRLKEIRPDICVLMVTAISDINTALSCIQMGAEDYIVKPFSLDRIFITVQNAFEKRRLKVENREYQTILEQRVLEQTRQIKRAMHELNLSYDYTLSALVKALDAREKEIGSHSERVMNYTLLLAEKCGVQEPELTVIAKGTLLHDIGKIGVSDNILLKGGKLDNIEWMEMKRHPIVGYEILSGIKSLSSTSHFVLSHHERFDGTGYPHGLKGREIPLSARIFAFADTLDAMTSDRPYRKAQPFSSVMAEVKMCSGSQFDPEISDVFLRVPRSAWEAVGEKKFL